jgi:hypothetical protein
MLPVRTNWGKAARYNTLVFGLRQLVMNPSRQAREKDLLVVVVTIAAGALEKASSLFEALAAYGYPRSISM